MSIKEHMFYLSRDEILTADPERLSYYGYSEDDILDAVDFQAEMHEVGVPEIEEREIEEIPGYTVTNFGEVISYKSGDARFLKQATMPRGYKKVLLHGADGKQYNRLVHRLVAKAFIKNPDNLPLVRHLNDIHDDNDVENLAWGTDRDNYEDMVRNGHDYHKGVYCYETNTEYHSSVEAERELGISSSEIRSVCRRERNSSHGYHFCYLEDKKYNLEHVDEWLDYRNGYKPLYAMNIETGEELYFKSRQEASECLGVPVLSIISVIKGRRKSSKGWTFRDYISDFY